MASIRDSRQKPSVAQELFGKVYVPHISDMVFKNHGGSYSCYQSDRSTWRAKVPYSAKIEDEIIMETKMFIIFIDKHVPNKAENPEFLMAFIRCVSDYLSAYTMKNPGVQGRTRKKAMEELKKTLWDDFKHIQAMLARQAAKRMAREARNQRYIGGGKSEKSDAKDAYKKMKATQRRLVSDRGPKQK